MALIQALRVTVVSMTHLVNEQDTRHNLRLALFSPVADFGVDLVSKFRFDLASVA